MSRKPFDLLIIIILLVPLAVRAERPAMVTQSQVEMLSLEQCLEFAYKNSQQIQSAAKGVEIAQAAVKEAEAGFLPSLTYFYNYNKYTTQDSNSSVLIPVGSGPVYDQVTYKNYNSISSTGLIFSQPLYTGGNLKNTLKIKQLSLEIAKEDERKAKEAITFNVKQAYYRCWAAEQMLIVAQNSYDNLNQHVNQVDTLYQAGTVSGYDLLKAKVQRDSLKPQVIAVRNGLALAKLNLLTLIGKDKSQDFTVQIDLGQVQIPDQNTINFNATLEKAYQNRSELHQIKQLIAINKLAVDLNMANYKPNVSMSVNYGGKDVGIHGEANAFPSSWGLTFNLMVTGTIWNGGATQAKVEQAKFNKDLTNIQESSIRDQIRTEVEQALQGLTQEIEATKANQANIDLAKEGLRMAEIRYNNGLGTTMDIMDAELALDQALNGYFAGVSNYLTAIAKLDFVVASDK